jgi:hypothetical protein
LVESTKRLVQSIRSARSVGVDASWLNGRIAESQMLFGDTLCRECYSMLEFVRVERPQPQTRSAIRARHVPGGESALRYSR